MNKCEAPAQGNYQYFYVFVLFTKFDSISVHCPENKNFGTFYGSISRFDCLRLGLTSISKKFRTVPEDLSAEITRSLRPEQK
jgi:hypothetical protein